MRDLRVDQGDGAMVSYINKEGDRVAIPFLRLGKEWKSVGIYMKFGASKSDPKFATILPLPHNWRPGSKIRKALRRQ